MSAMQAQQPQVAQLGEQFGASSFFSIEHAEAQVIALQSKVGQSRGDKKRLAKLIDKIKMAKMKRRTRTQLMLLPAESIRSHSTALDRAAAVAAQVRVSSPSALLVCGTFTLGSQMKTFRLAQQMVSDIASSKR